MFEQVEDQQNKRRSKEPNHLPIRVVVYGASLFLTAVTVTLQQYPVIDLVHLPLVATKNSILEQKPNILLWQRNRPLENSAGLLAAGVWLLEIDEQQSTIIIQHYSCQETCTKSIPKSTDLISWIIERTRMETSGSMS